MRCVFFIVQDMCCKVSSEWSLEETDDIEHLTLVGCQALNAIVHTGIESGLALRIFQAGWSSLLSGLEFCLDSVQKGLQVGGRFGKATGQKSDAEWMAFDTAAQFPVHIR